MWPWLVCGAEVAKPLGDVNISGVSEKAPPGAGLTVRSHRQSNVVCGGMLESSR
jgi:hypothetical protein